MKDNGAGIANIFELLHCKHRIPVNIECHFLGLGPFFLTLIKYDAVFKAQYVHEHASVCDVHVKKIDEPSESPADKIVELVEEAIDLGADLVEGLNHYEGVMCDHVHDEDQHQHTILQPEEEVGDVLRHTLSQVSPRRYNHQGNQEEVYRRREKYEFVITRVILHRLHILGDENVLVFNSIKIAILNHDIVHSLQNGYQEIQQEDV